MIDSTDRVIGFKWVESRTDQTGRSSGLGLPRGDLLTTMMSKQIDPGRGRRIDPLSDGVEQELPTDVSGDVLEHL